MPRALHTAATGMMAQQLRIDVIAHNLSNVNTTGFKRSRLEFQDLLYQTLKLGGVGTTRQTEAPAGLQIGHGTRSVATQRNFSSGDLQNTENQLDIAIEGRGFLQVRLPSGELVYSRDGALKLDSQGQLVTSDGYPIEPPIVVPIDTLQINIGSDGLVTATTSARGQSTELGNIFLSHILNPGVLEAMGRNLYRMSTDAGETIVARPGEEGLGTLAQGFLESSNVRVVEEMIAMIVGQRAYEANSKVIQTADRMREDANRMR